MSRPLAQPDSVRPIPEHFLDAALAMSLDDVEQPERAAGALRQRELDPATWMAGWFAGHELRGVIRAGHPPFAAFVEASLFVDQRWRRQGIGSALLDAAISWGRRRQAGTIRFYGERDEWPMRHFASKFGARLDLVLGRVVVDFPTGVQP